MKKPVFLVGYMGCGKTTLGAALASVLQVPFVDLDERIEQQCGVSVAQFITTQGERRFREVEAAQLRQVLTMPVVVACGGGTPCYGNGIRVMNRYGVTVWLTTSVERLVARLMLEEEHRKRPRLAQLDHDGVMRLVNNERTVREPYYKQAQVQFDSTDIETAATTQATARRLAQQLSPLL